MRPLERIFNAYGRLLARHPLPFLVIPLITTLTSTMGLFSFHSQDDIWDIYSPLNGMSRVEEKALERFEYASSAHHYRIQILVSRKDDGNLMNRANLNEMMAMQRYISENISISDGEQSYLYHDVCGIYCNDSNAIILGFVRAVVDMKGESSSLMLTYPNAQALQRRLFVGQVTANVSMLYSIGHLHMLQRQQQPSVVDRFKLFVLHYMVNLRLPNGRILAVNFERQLRDLFHQASDQSKDLNFALLSRDRELEEQREITLVALPYLAVTALLLTAFMIITLIDFPLYKSQHIEAITGIVSPGMALVTTAGLLWGIGYPFSNILTVVPFLVVTIGIDDAFLILAGWRHSNPSADLEERMGEALAKSGASVTVTSITDVLCFAVGLISNMPVVQLFCLYTSVALTIDFIYQVTFFSAMVVYCGKRQIRIDEATKFKARKFPLKPNGVIDRMMAKVAELSQCIGNLKPLKKATVAPTKQMPIEGCIDAKSQYKHKDALLRFVGFLHHPVTTGAVLFIFVMHITASCYLCTQVNTDFSMENLYLKDSPLNSISRKMQQFVLKEAFVVNFAIYPMPNFADSFIREKFNRLVEELETIPNFSVGPSGTNLWTREFADAVAFWGEESEFWKQDELLSYFREYGMEDKYVTTVRRADGKEVMTGFFWSITYHNMSNFLDVKILMEKRRSIIAKYAEFFNVSSHHPLEKVPTESAASAPANFIQTAASAVILMSVLVFLFVLDVGAIISVVLSIISICVGTVGYLHLWDVRLDAVSLISMLMSIGFSVDYSAHICYHFFTHKQKSGARSEPASSNGSRSISIIVGSESTLSSASLPVSGCSQSSTRVRLEDTFKAVGWPVIQSGISTLLGMVPLIVVRAYVVAVFWKTVLLVTFLGMFHALFLLPVIFIVLSDCIAIIRRVCR
ncbi:Patched domain-containing protein 3 [Toxocara canis]|uniref:Patched domain-containing protein 3 n=1 Tax=Toxocara canis TaxID=6265 RepID=A0A0B2VTL5_TOXCA|nr:Patched domain-containing protein 3 [Toxocara canis]